MEKAIYFKLSKAAIVSVILVLACANEDEQPVVSELEKARMEYEEMKANHAFVELAFPEDDPGPPFYARIAVLGPDKLIMESNGTIVIPMMREVQCIDPEFNLLDLYHVPNGFFCPLTLSGRGLIEPNAPMGTFPAIAYGTGSNMPVWFVDSAPLLNAISDGILTLPELEALNPRKGIASRYEEYNKPRTEEDYLLVIESEGSILGTNQRFAYKVISRTKARQDVELKFW
ncbi:MAG: hypothetical protein EA341_11510 [Mongoliibacter sp.]|uniref:hypothetical protein n=1 Tax=Mongoliibacter sp. TaxID=2022438 RepID=UPI0012F36C79|nr:hypothetical protein [Mongoliibacter sp.]TVP48106.1 MAG: hypothetical protein EA341_11510 [Mongoliibacter sp.]